MTKTITVSDVIPAAAAEIYAAWLDSMAHAAMTGGGKATASPDIGAPYSAWDGYINGLNLALDPGQRIEQSWRSTDFTPGDPDSTLTVLLEPAEQGTKVTLVHTGVPDQLADFADGWRQYYFEPMKSYFARLMAPMPEPRETTAAEPAGEPAAQKKAAARKAAAKKPAAGKKAAAGKATGKSSARMVAKKPVAKARMTKKAASRRTTKKVAAAKKSGGRTATAKKPAAKKPAARKSSTRKTPKTAAARKHAAPKPAARRSTKPTRKRRR
jgi:hypothetical protein